MKHPTLLSFVIVIVSLLLETGAAFVSSISNGNKGRMYRSAGSILLAQKDWRLRRGIASLDNPKKNGPPFEQTKLKMNKSDQEVEEETRMNVLTSRRKTIRSALKGAESLRNFRIENGESLIKMYYCIQFLVLYRLVLYRLFLRYS
jgi:hypothetical protein